MLTKLHAKLFTEARFLDVGINANDGLEDVAQMAAVLFSVTFAAITLINHPQIYLSNKFSKNAADGLRRQPLYQHLVRQRKLLLINDITTDQQLKEQAFSIGKRKLSFYVSLPLITHDKHHVGNLLLMCYDPQQISKAQKKLFKTLAKRIVHLLELGHSMQVLRAQHQQAQDVDIKLRSFFESSAACHMLIGKQLEVLVFNRNMAELIMHHYDVTLFAGINVDKILKGNFLEDFISDYHQALAGTSIMYEREVKYPKETIWWHVTFEPGYDTDGKVIGISYNAANITERKKQEQKITEQNQSFRNIAYIQSHELRKPVASIMGFMYLFKYEGYKATREELMMMEQAVNQLDEKIREIVKISTPVE